LRPRYFLGVALRGLRSNRVPRSVTSRGVSRRFSSIFARASSK
jgi:hypothetical protein